MRKLEWVCRPKISFLIALLVLIPVHLVHIGSSPWFSSLPKPDGDGPDYENIAFHLYTQQEYRFDNSDVRWRSLYVADSSGEPERYTAQLTAPQRNLLATGRPPLLPTLIAALYHMFGRNADAFRAIHLLLALSLAISGAVAAAVTAMTWQRTSHARTTRFQLAGLLAIGATIALAATQRTLKGYAEDFLTEPLALLLLQLFVLCAMQVGDTRSQPFTPDSPAPTPLPATRNRRGDESEVSGQSHVATRLDSLQNIPLLWLALCGILFALAIMARSVFVLWLPGVAVLLWLALPRDSNAQARKSTASQLAVFIAICLLCCLPWWIRNVSVLRSFMPLGTQGPITLVGGFCDDAMDAGGDWQFNPERQLRARMQSNPTWLSAEDDTQREVLVARAASREVRSWIADHWTQLPSLAWARIVTHWNPYSGRSLVWKALILLGAGWLACQRGTARIWLIGLPILSTAVTALLYSTGGRFLVPLYGILFTLAGLGVGRITLQFLPNSKDSGS